MRARGGKVWFIGPEFSEIGIAQADEWIQIKPYTDTALVLGMLHHMITETVDASGTLTGRGLDLDYIDTMVYGFFDSPAYYLNPTTGAISLTNPGDGSILIPEVPAGRSLSAYVLGSNDNRLTKLAYGNSNYTATQFGGNSRMRNMTTCSYTSKVSAPSFAYKSHFAEAKDPEWAEKITGVPAAKIRELANVYLDSSKRIWNEWAGGLQKQAEGVTGIMAIQTLCILTKVWGYKGGGFMNQAITPSRTANANQLTDAEVQANVKWGEVTKMREHPQPSVAQWHNAIKAAFGNELYDNGYRPENIADWDYEEGGEKRTLKGHAYLDDGGVKALVNRNSCENPGQFVGPYKDIPALKTYTGDDGGTYYEYDGRGTSTAGGGETYAGFRFILNTGGNIPVNQHPNCSDLAKMYEYLPSWGHAEGFNAENEADSFCLVTFDNFMSPSARYSDYVLPAKTTWEQEDFKSLDQSGGTMLYIDDVIPGPGESKSTWEFARDFIAACDGDVAKFTGGDATTTFKDVAMKAFATKSASGNGPYAGKTWEEFLEKPFITPEYNTTYEEYTESALRKELNNYLNNPITPFPVATVTSSGYTFKIDCATAGKHYGFGSDGYSNPAACPNTAGRFMVYMPQLVWCYENAYSKWHGHLPKEERGQKNEDIDGDPIVYPIIMYFDYQDYFAEAYGVDRSELTREKGYFLLTTTHDRFRAHSSQAENPFLRELTHRTKGGALYSGNDSGAYAVSNGDNITFPALNTLIGDDGQPVAGAENRASYADIWVNDEDFADFNDGDLVKVYNNVGAVYCTIRKTARCVKGYVGLHQGCWYDPRTINGQTVDVGGNCNTIMASRPSRYDHGNAAQSAMVKIERV